MAIKFLQKLFGKSPAPAQSAAPRREVVIVHEFKDAPVQANVSGSYFTNPYSSYEALANSPDRTTITVNAIGPMLGSSNLWLPAPVVNFQRLQLGAISRYLYNNFGLFSYGVDLIADYSLPVVPKAQTSNPKLNEIYDDYFSDWAKSADYSGRFDFWELQRLASKAIDVMGDQGHMMVSENGFPQVQTIEGWRIGTIKNPPGLRIIDGVVLDNKGVVTGFIIMGENGPEVVSANQFLLLYDADRFHDYRGMSPGRRGSNDIRDHADLKGFAKKASKIAAALAGIIEGGPLMEDTWGNDTGNADNPGTAPVDGLNPDGTLATKQDLNISIAKLLGGEIPTLPAGQTFRTLENKQPGILTVDFLSELAGLHVAGLGLPPAFFVDSKLTGPNIRAVIGKAQRKFNGRAGMMAKFAEWAWFRVMGDAIEKGRVPRAPDFRRITFQYPAQFTIDLGDQARNDRDDVIAGQMTRQERFGKRARDWQREADQTDRELDYIFDKAQAQATKRKLPIETVLAAYGFDSTQAKKAEQPPAGAPAVDGTK